MFTLRVGKISTMLGTWTQKKSRAKQEKKKKKEVGKKICALFSLLSILFQREFIKALLS